MSHDPQAPYTPGYQAPPPPPAAANVPGSSWTGPPPGPPGQARYGMPAGPPAPPGLSGPPGQPPSTWNTSGPAGPPGSAPPPRRRTVLITAAVVVTAVLVVVLGGWVWPGWWTTTAVPGGQVPPNAPFPPASVPAAPPTASKPAPPTGGDNAEGSGQADQTTAKGTATLLVAALQAGNLDGILRLTCAAGHKPRKDGPQDRSAVVDDLITQIPPWNPDHPELVVVRMKFTLGQVVPGPEANEAGAQVNLAFDNVPPAAKSDPKLGPLMVNHTGTVTLIKETAGNWVNCGLNLGPPKSGR